MGLSAIEKHPQVFLWKTFKRLGNFWRTHVADYPYYSYYDLDDPTWLEFAYTQLLGDVVDGMAPAGDAIAGLHLGGGGFTLPRYHHPT